MLRSVRKKVANSISKVDEVEDFHFHTWLRPGSIENIPLNSIYSSVRKPPDINYNIEEPDIYGQPIGLDSINLIPHQGQYFFATVQYTNINFGMNPSETKGIDLSGIVPKARGFVALNVEFRFPEAKPKEFKVKFDPRLPSLQNFLFSEPLIVDCLAAMTPEVINIELLKVEEFANKYPDVKVDEFNIDEFKTSKLKKIDIPAVKRSEKIYKVKIPGIGNYESTVSKLKLDHIKSPKCFDKSDIKFDQISVTTDKFEFSENANFKYYDVKDEDLKQVKEFKQKGYLSPKKIKDKINEILKVAQKTEPKEIKDNINETPNVVQKTKLKEIKDDINEILNVEEKTESKESEIQEFKILPDENEILNVVEKTESKESKEQEIKILPDENEISNNAQKTEWKESAVKEYTLLPYEEEGAGFLAEHDRALLLDEFGINKHREALAALIFLFNNQIIKTALIVSGTGNAGNSELSRKCNLEIGWLGNLVKYCPDLTVSEIKGDDNARKSAWNKNAMVYVAEHRIAVNDYHTKILDQKKLKQFDCIILDEAHALIGKGDKVDDFLSHLNSKTLWAISGLINENIKTSLNALLNKKMKIDAVKIRRKEDLKDQTPQFIWNENWATLDEKQQQEYKETLVQCQKDLRKVLDTGNPYRFQANIFTLIHKLKQICNFGQGKTESPKGELLLEHVSMIRDNGKKVLIFSQYDRLGIKSIEKLFEARGIGYILAPGGLSVDDMDKSVNKFIKSNEITAFITDAKISKLRFGKATIPYIIKFDHWWNPITVWELQDLFDFRGKPKDSSINIYSYNVHNTIDQNVTELLSGKGILNKNLMEMMQSKVFDELITVDEWLKFFSMPPSKDFVEMNPDDMLQSLKKVNTGGFKTMLTKLFNKVGYSKIDILDDPDKVSFSIVGESSRNGNSTFLTCKVLLAEDISIKTVSDIIAKAGSLQNKRLIIITKGKFGDGCENVISESVALIDGISLARTLQSFKIQDTSTSAT